ncbi:DUF2141 domain-containing protein [Parerythrobacter jejuensis]|uniref:DUF2141 domain-containing protein n=1 Tax=Parerythrobacter jejuensis TaxID=795812 RepID=UPI002D80007C|nr:DUF2141 domain-containing protein [Parerythrobacter jejuensis]
MAAALASTGSAAAQSHNVRVTVTDLRSGDGKVLACLTRKAKAFPNCDKDPDAISATVDAATTVTFTFRGVTPGEYAISLLHDENANGKADRTLMIPREGFGFSRDAKIRMGPPKFADAVFTVDQTTGVQRIRMRYLFR